VVTDLAGARAPLVVGGGASIAAAGWGWAAARKEAGQRVAQEIPR